MKKLTEFSTIDNTRHYSNSTTHQSLSVPESIGRSISHDSSSGTFDEVFVSPTTSEVMSPDCTAENFDEEFTSESVINEIFSLQS